MNGLMGDSLEQVVVFERGPESLYGVLHNPEQVTVDTGVVILVGGPQYRVGSHRQFVDLARGLANAGIPVFRFDFTGMGDSTGVFPGFENLDEDVRIAIDAFLEKRSELSRIVLWGLCDGASAACFYAPQDKRVVGLSLANPWVRTEQGEAQAFLKHYYLARLVNREFWGKLLTGKLKLFQTVTDLLRNVKRSRADISEQSSGAKANNRQVGSLPDRVFRGLELFPGKVMLLISGNDLTAAEFIDAINKDRKRQKLIGSNKVQLTQLSDADHTFSRRVWMDEVISETASWIKKL